MDPVPGHQKEIEKNPFNSRKSKIVENENPTKIVQKIF
jgi:hypothetical protein